MTFDPGPAGTDHQGLGRVRPGSNFAMIKLKCGHVIDTGVRMFALQVKKGEQRECPEGCGLQGIKQVESRDWRN